jgi:hypothetical protein
MALKTMKNKFIVTVIVLVAAIIVFSGIHFWSISKRLHPSIKKYYKISLDVPEIKKKADAGVPFSIVLGEKTVKVVVKPNPVFHKGVEAIEMAKNGIKRKKIEDIITYAGTVVDPNQANTVRFTITKEFLTGYIFIDEDWWFIEPLKKFQPDASDKEFITYRTKDLRFKLNYGNDTSESETKEKPPIGSKKAIDLGFISTPVTKGPLLSTMTRPLI